MATLITPRTEKLTRHLSPLGLLRDLWRRRDLIRQFTWREVIGRYKGSYLGVLWSFANPLALLLIYTFVFGVVFDARWPQARHGSLSEFALTIFCGMIAFNVFGETVTRAPQLITSVPNYVKKVVFPLEILPVSALGAALFHAGVSLTVLLLAELLVNGNLPWTVVLLPLPLLPLVLLSAGCAWLLASLGVFVRDIGYAIVPLMQMLFFATPIFYPLEAVPRRVQALIGLNPLATIVESCRQLIVWGQIPSLAPLLIWSLIGLAVAALGYAFFMRSKRAFADVI